MLTRMHVGHARMHTRRTQMYYVRRLRYLIFLHTQQDRVCGGLRGHNAAIFLTAGTYGRGTGKQGEVKVGQSRVDRYPGTDALAG